MFAGPFPTASTARLPYREEPVVVGLNVVKVHRWVLGFGFRVLALFLKSLFNVQGLGIRVLHVV